MIASNIWGETGAKNQRRQSCVGRIHVGGYSDDIAQGVVIGNLSSFTWNLGPKEGKHMKRFHQRFPGGVGGRGNGQSLSTRTPVEREGEPLM